ncbi:MAG: XdhC family protein [Candidatus Hydrogenedentota bacterium]|nr:MAG: XdhC family protein [Candidatus Hydrogenedentota bacterium]
MPAQETSKTGGVGGDTELFRKAAEILSRGEPFVMATVVRTRGSTPRKAGARMIVDRRGNRYGTISGGCVEAEVYAAARERFGKSGSDLLSFTLNDDAAAEYGLRCGGTMEVFVERVDPKPVLFLVGAGHINSALARLGVLLGFEVHLLDDHPGFLDPADHPAEVVLHECAIEAAAEKIPSGSHVAVVIATRGHKQDSAAFRPLSGRDLGYLGLVSSRKRVLEFYSQLKEEGVPVERLERIAAPVGLDIGAHSPPEIAVAIIAEILARFRNGSGKPLREAFWALPGTRKVLCGETR